MSGSRRPRFKRQESWRLKRVRDSWRRPRGVTSRMRKEKGGWPRRVRIGYGTTSLSKGLHPRGLSERLVGKLSDLEGLDPKLHIVRFSARLGERKRLLFLEKAKEFGLRVANPGKVEITRPEEGKEEETTVPVIEKAMEEKETADASTESASEEESAT